MLKDLEKLSFEDGVNELIERVKKYNFSEESLNRVKEYYGYFYNRKNNRTVAFHDQRNIFLNCCDEYVVKSLKKDIEDVLEKQGLINSGTIQTVYLKSIEDVQQLSREFLEESEDGRRKDIYRYVSIIVMAAPEDRTNDCDIKELLETKERKLYREHLKYHLYSKATLEDILYEQTLEQLERQHSCHDEFKKQLFSYIKHVMPNREIKDNDAFVEDIVKRVLDKYAGIQDVSKSSVIKVECVPYSQQVDKNNKRESRNTYIIKGAEDIQLNENGEFDEDISNVMLLNMSTINPRMEKMTFCYEQDEDQKVDTYGQLEPTVLYLDQYVLRPIGQKVDLVIITATDACFDNEVEFEFENQWVKTNAIDFFKYRIHQECDHEGENPVRFATVKIDNEINTIKTVVDMIRGIKGKCQTNPNQTFRLYTDIHGGLRSTQLVFDAIVNTLKIDGIEVEKALTCEFDRSVVVQRICDVTKKLEIFGFASGIHEFINYGSVKELERYNKRVFNDRLLNNDKIDNNNGDIVKNIKEISDALQLCQIKKFEKALDRLWGTIEKMGSNDYTDTDKDTLIKIYIDNIKNDYDKLLSNKRTLYDLVSWAYRKGMYQQALAIIESKTPKFIFEHLLYFYDSNVPLSQDRFNISFDGSSDEKAYMLETKSYESYENVCYRFMYYKTERINEVSDRDVQERDNAITVANVDTFEKESYEDGVYVKHTQNNTSKYDPTKKTIQKITFTSRIDNGDYIECKSGRSLNVCELKQEDGEIKVKNKLKHKYPTVYIKKRHKDIWEHAETADGKSMWDVFNEVGKYWYKLKLNRNRIFHVSDEPLEIEKVKEDIGEYLKNLKVLNDQFVLSDE